ncbi:unnamed protein product [Meloidogyne enterolobii]|uniref:Uncharacterized protein n=1 Tax=Meloidogyne enterolobii TaxID=390850 RepID=A0ACB1B462_MELEN
MVDSTMVSDLNQEEVNDICIKALQDQIRSPSYQHTEAVKWNQNVVETVTESLVRLGYPYKYCVCCVIMQAGLGAGLNIASMCFWDKQIDVTFVVRWESKAVIAVCNVFALRLDNLPPQIMKSDVEENCDGHVNTNGGS